MTARPTNQAGPQANDCTVTPEVERTLSLHDLKNIAIALGDYAEAHDVRLRMRQHAIDTNAPAQLLALIDSDIAAAQTTLVGQTPYARTYGDGRIELSVLGFVRWLYEMNDDDRVQMSADAQARNWPRIGAFQQRVNVRRAVLEAMGQPSDLADAFAGAVDLEAVGEAIKRGEDPVELVLNAREDLS